MAKTDKQVAELEVPLIEIGDGREFLCLQPIGKARAGAFGVEVMMTITGTRLHLRVIDDPDREFTVDILHLADTAIRAIEAQLRAEKAGGDIGFEEESV